MHEQITAINRLIINISKSQLLFVCLSVVKVRCIGMLSPTQLLYIVYG